MSQLVPSVGMSGSWTLKPPLDNYLLTNVIYTCRSLRSISECIANNEDVKYTIYRKIGLTETDYNTDFKNNVYIVTLQSANGNWYNIPASFIEKYPTTTGVIYQKNMIGVGLPNLPIDTDFTILKEKISSITFDMLGLTPDVRVVPIGESKLVDYEDHDNNIKLRNNNKTFAYTDRVQIRILEEQNNQLKTLLNKIQSCMVGKCKTDGKICLPTFNEGTPGESGYIDALDLLIPKCLYATNAIDLFIYGYKIPNRTLYENESLIDRSDGVNEDDTPGNDDDIDADDYGRDERKNVNIAMNAYDLFIFRELPSRMRNFINNDDKIYEPPVIDRSDDVNDDLVPYETQEELTITDTVILLTYPELHNKGETPVKLFLLSHQDNEIHLSRGRRIVDEDIIYEQLCNKNTAAKLFMSDIIDDTTYISRKKVHQYLDEDDTMKLGFMQNIPATTASKLYLSLFDEESNEYVVKIKETSCNDIDAYDLFTHGRSAAKLFILTLDEKLDMTVTLSAKTKSRVCDEMIAADLFL